MRVLLCTLAALASLFALSIGQAADTKEARTLGKIERLDPAFDKLVGKDAVIELLEEKKFEWAEGPVWLASEKAVLFSDIPNDRIMRYDETNGAVSVFRTPSNNANGTVLESGVSIRWIAGYTSDEYQRSTAPAGTGTTAAAAAHATSAMPARFIRPTCRRW